MTRPFRNVAAAHRAKLVSLAGDRGEDLGAPRRRIRDSRIANVAMSNRVLPKKSARDGDGATGREFLSTRYIVSWPFSTILNGFRPMAVL
jgi:hypothetical protein